MKPKKRNIGKVIEVTIGANEWKAKNSAFLTLKQGENFSITVRANKPGQHLKVAIDYVESTLLGGAEVLPWRRSKTSSERRSSARSAR